MPEDRDRLFEKALARHLRDNPGEDPTSCPDAETLAAYHERMLSADEMASTKDHLVSCARCQEILAQLEATESVTDSREGDQVPATMHAAVLAGHHEIFEEAAAPAESSTSPRTASAKVAAWPDKTRKRSSLRWAVPVGALAAGLLLYVGASQFRFSAPASKSAPQVAENRDEAYSQAQASPPSAQLQTPVPPRGGRDDGGKLAPVPPAELTDALKSDNAPAAKSEGRLQSAGKPAAKPLNAPEMNLNKLDDSKDQRQSEGIGAGLGGVARQKQQITDSKSGDLEMQMRSQAQLEQKKSPVVGGAVSAAAPPPPPAPSPVAPSASASSSPDAFEKAKSSVKETAVETGSENSVRKEAAGSVALLRSVAGDAAAPQIIVAPDGKNIWRLGKDGAISHSKNGGKGWDPQVSGVTANLISGSCPTARVCWIAGSAGTLLRTSDGGKRWQVVLTPISADLGGVQASDENHAVIWDAPNRLGYQTSDGGATWQKTSQE